MPRGEEALGKNSREAFAARGREGEGKREREDNGREGRSAFPEGNTRRAEMRGQDTYARYLPAAVLKIFLTQIRNQITDL